MKIIDVGRVTAVYSERCTAKVFFDDKNMVSPELPILTRGSQGVKDYWMPEVGEQVVCAFLENTSKGGFIMGSFFNEVDRPPIDSDKKQHLQFPDGTYIEYDQDTHTLTVDVQGDITIKTAVAVHVEGDVIAEGVSLKNHTHTFYGSSGTTSGPLEGA
ncbi:phage baseplate assembly protein V [Domibacillus aminovorans]|uniref:phage baseplate assembly protein V n=1 Tax=Domibacillus aminovorans TaxID=29332 RepID=UPI003D1F2B3B